MKKLLLTIPCFLLLVFGCNDAKNRFTTSIVEKSIEAISGQKIDIADANDIEKNEAEVNITLHGENLKNYFKKGFGSVTASKETIAITIAGGENGQDNILIGFTGKERIASHPIKGKMVMGHNDGFTFSITKATDNGIDMQLSFEAEGEIVSMQKDKVIIKVKGKTGSSSDAESPEKWKSYEGTITLNYPVFQALGSSKEKFIY
ncbi:hypothetical protein FAZ15_09890 [Sphingobacterium olei]|uniref:Lipoprotein n=1 Tax=Sphingobacterium olei TaxID=2571155 RepID=A0A4U0P4C3_9SPHI|nr:hypothetical protein [Sphingobacterium olei]TJZ61492.1 hypothetical protein FAZ15_09890 [Sphingobacterium olei]